MVTLPALVTMENSQGCPSQSRRVLLAPRKPEHSELLTSDKVVKVLQFLRQRYPYVVIDLPHDFRDTTLAGLDAAQEIITVIAPELASVRSMAVALEVFDSLEYPREKIHLVLNWIFEKRGLARKDIETALRQPMAQDLRFITMAMEITTDLERMADLAVDIAQRVLEIASEPMLKPLVDIPELAKISQGMVKNVLESFVKEDADLAGHVIMTDNKADALRDAIQRELVNDYMMKDPGTIKRALALLLIARHLERICDHATNIAEDVIYMKKARFIRHSTKEKNSDA